MIIFYKTATEDIITDREIESAFTITTGKTKDTDKSGYLKFLANLYEKKFITEIDNPTVEDFIKNRHIVCATRLYADLNNCGIIQAKHAVDAIANEIYAEMDKMEDD